jgi:hypothetical protein
MELYIHCMILTLQQNCGDDWPPMPLWVRSCQIISSLWSWPLSWNAMVCQLFQVSLQHKEIVLAFHEVDFGERHS